jgi:hypothetical protein
MSSTNLPATLTDRSALDRALTTVAEESFFAMVDPVAGRVPEVTGPMLSVRVTFDGAFDGALNCLMPRQLAQELTAAFTGEEVLSEGPGVDDLAGEFTNMVCGRWLTDVAPQSLFKLAHPVVVPVGAPSGAPMGLLNGHPIWIEFTIEGPAKAGRCA